MRMMQRVGLILMQNPLFCSCFAQTIFAALALWLFHQTKDTPEIEEGGRAYDSE